MQPERAAFDVLARVESTPELLARIFAYLDTDEDLARACAVKRSWLASAGAEDLWQARCAQSFPLASALKLRTGSTLSYRRLLAQRREIDELERVAKGHAEEKQLLENEIQHLNERIRLIKLKKNTSFVAMCASDVFCGQFDVPSFRKENPTMPEHATETSVVVRATDKFPKTDADGHKCRDVVLKLMKHKKQFDNEQDQRKELDPRYLLRVIYTSTDDGLEAKWMKELPPEYREYKFGIVMPAAERNLTFVVLQERVDLAQIKTMFSSFTRALGHLHARGVIQGDFKPGNVVRMFDGEHTRASRRARPTHPTPHTSCVSAQARGC